MRDVRLLVGEAWRRGPRGVVVQVLALLLNGLLAGASLLLLIPIVNSLADSSVQLAIPLVDSLDLSEVPLWVLLAAFVTIIAVQALVSVLATTTTTRTQQKLIDHLRQDAFAAVLAARWTFVLQRRRSDIVTIITLGAVRAGMAYNQLLQVAVATVFAIVSAAIALVLSPVVAGIAIAGVIAMGILQSLSIRPAHRLGGELSQRHRTVQGVVSDSLDSLRLIRAHSASAIWIERLADAFTGTREVQVANVRRQSLVNGASAVGIAIAASALVLIAVGLDEPAATIAVILVVVFRLALSVRQLVASAALMASSLPAVRDLAELTEQATAAKEIAAHSVCDRGELSAGQRTDLIEFSDVTYSYPGSESGVRDLSFRVPRGMITALSGPSGIGKSTAVDLAIGLLGQDSGEILIDGVPLDPADVTWWRSHISYVPQETLLIPGTLRDNLTWSVQRACSDEECWSALDLAAARFARELPAGLDTDLGDRGVRLSGGERQRVAIARALLRRPVLLVLDEATSALDDDTESEILDVLTALTPATTVLIVAHRRSSIDAADHVVHFDATR